MPLIKFAIIFATATFLLSESAFANSVLFKYASVDGLKLFYRESGDPAKETILLLHGFPSSSAMFRKLIPELSDDFHVIAPDYPGMGNSDGFPHETFDSVSSIIGKFIKSVGDQHLIVYMQGFGAPVGMRLAVESPSAIDGLIIQNAPISLSGWDIPHLRAIAAAQRLGPADRRAFAEQDVTIATSILLHQQGATKSYKLDPNDWAADAFALSNPEKRQNMSDLEMDIPSNFPLYPKWQEYLRISHPKTLVVWGTKDPVLSPQGAIAVKQANPNTIVRFYDTGQFALDEDSSDIALEIKRRFSH